MTPVSVILIRENAEQVTGSGCCGKLEGDDELVRRADLFRETRLCQESFGVLHRAIREFFPDEQGVQRVRVVTVDPRNQLYLASKLWYDVFRYRPGWREGTRTMTQWFALPAVVVNGRVVSDSQGAPSPDELCHVIASLLNPSQHCDSEV
ncbi:hypothetical protein Pan216_57860 [Planctomycetes bacterium Pan216]|uniref:Uncharacterized protein n=1 Tax=Kolteria novifilia TaxID=2527975 RepID=A0A518BD33_9BACT|nr:hypothetical protein Pan216_57860 [Planctomycetes bacterium Pan216]